MRKGSSRGGSGRGPRSLSNHQQGRLTGIDRILLAEEHFFQIQSSERWQADLFMLGLSLFQAGIAHIGVWHWHHFVLHDIVRTSLA